MGRILRLLKKGMDFEFGKTKHESIEAGSVNTEEVTIGAGSVTQTITNHSLTEVPTTGRDHKGWSAIVYHPDERKLILVYREADRHSATSNQEIRAIDSEDGGDTWTNDRAVSPANNDSDYPRPKEGMLMDDGRIGFLCHRTDSSNNLSSAGFLYSDDIGSSWTFDALSNPADRTPGSMTRFPSSVGGDDDGGWVFYQSNQSNEIYAIYTTDNGESWSSTQVSSGDYTEPSVARLGTLNRWVMVLRDGSGGNAAIMQTTDPLDWPQPSDMGQDLEENKPTLWYQNGMLHLMSASRLYRSREIDGFGNSIVYQSSPAINVWEDVTDWPGWSKIVTMPAPEGYCTVTQIGSQSIISAIGGPEADTATSFVLRPQEQTEARAGLKNTLVSLNGDQSVGSDTADYIDFAQEDSRGWIGDLLNDNGAVVVPDGYDYARVVAGIRWSTSTDYDVFGVRLNGSKVQGGAEVEGSNVRMSTLQSGYFRVSQGDEIAIRVRHQEGSTIDIQDSEETFMDVTFI